MVKRNGVALPLLVVCALLAMGAITVSVRYVADESTLSLTGNQFAVKSGGIGPTQLAATAVTAGTYVMPGSLAVDGDGRTTAITANRTVSHNTTGTIAVPATACGTLYTSSGASADVTYSLAAIAAAAGTEGCRFTFLQTDTNFDIYVDPADTDQFRGQYTTNANGDRLVGDKVEGSTLDIVVVKDDAGTYRWFARGWGGWTDAD